MTHQEYAKYEAKVSHFMRGLVAISTGPRPGCPSCLKEYGDVEAIERAETWFSWSPCEICESTLGGDRCEWHALEAGEIADPRNIWPEVIHGTCCMDCMYYLNYGRLDDKTMAEVAQCGVPACA